MLERLVKKIYELRQNEYLYKRDKVGNLVSHWLRLASVEDGSVISAYIKMQVENLHLPTQLWMLM